ncbi:MAG: Na(+)-translocating NADH-quinone reductase subunit A [Bacteroidales bacterium]|nr:Na(+)-translocating NADH-quinone reductase subunit A [Bacteroidales bacterium]HOY38956.1 Na(+)-translocating NADH-quinone reductase subunit A [Bacteroidales bacterium]HQP03948.1 Na(+)-translocating NADH-quinone reductase subunit A [Bacteroidales bacterium]
MKNHISVKQGLDIRLYGEANKIIQNETASSSYALVPDDFPGLTSKPVAQPGDTLKIGSLVFVDKYKPEIRFVSPVSGILKDIVRGEKRKIMKYLIIPDDTNDTEVFEKPDVNTLTREQSVSFLCNAGLWPFVTQRPYGVIANPETTPKSIFISFYDTAPLAPDYEFFLKDYLQQMIHGLKIIRPLTTGKIHLGFAKNSGLIQSFLGLDFVETHTISGPHPAGNVGTIINKIDPINKGEIVFTLMPQDIVSIGNTALSGKYSPERIIAVTGSELTHTGYVKTRHGASIKSLLNGNVEHDPDAVRIVSGNVLTGTNVGYKGYLGYKHPQITAIPEGKKYVMFGWMKPGFKKFSNSHTYFSWLFPKRRYRIDTNLNGGLRNLVVTGEYEKVCPFDIYPQYLIKAIIAKDIDKMEQLGIYEVIEEDLALCEFVCTSKTQIQAILREGLDLIRSEMN